VAINSFDDSAIATDKTAYLWENPGAATFANVSSYTKGINGIMVDITGSHSNITADDFIFRVGNNNSPGLWATASAPTQVSVRTEAGVGGSDRVTIIWNGAAAPAKQWLQVVVLANADTGLHQQPGYPAGYGDVFFFGSAPGNTGLGDSAVNSQVNAADENGIRLNPTSPGANIPIANLYDVNRNGQVNASDESAARLNSTTPGTSLKYLNLTGSPSAPEAEGGDGNHESGDELSPLAAPGDSGVAAGLSAPGRTSSEGALPRWLSNRIDSIDLKSVDSNSDDPDKLFQHLHDTNGPRSRALLHRFDAAADARGPSEELLDLLLADRFAQTRPRSLRQQR
jgi:hypothetical protein